MLRLLTVWYSVAAKIVEIDRLHSQLDNHFIFYLGGFALNFSTIGDDDRLGCASTGASHGFDSLHDVHTRLNTAKDDMLAIQPLGFGRGQKELTPICVRPSIGAGQETWNLVRNPSIFPFIVKPATIDTAETMRNFTSELPESARKE